MRKLPKPKPLLLNMPDEFIERKRRYREEDAAAISSGRKTPAEVHRDNSFVATITADGTILHHELAKWLDERKTKK